MPEELQITLFRPPQRIDAEIPDAAHNESSLRLLSSGCRGFL
jgi:hypothetical protein